MPLSGPPNDPCGGQQPPNLPPQAFGFTQGLGDLLMQLLAGRRAIVMGSVPKCRHRAAVTSRESHARISSGMELAG